MSNSSSFKVSFKRFYVTVYRVSPLRVPLRGLYVEQLSGFRDGFGNTG